MSLRHRAPVRLGISRLDGAYAFHMHRDFDEIGCTQERLWELRDLTYRAGPTGHLARATTTGW